MVCKSQVLRPEAYRIEVMILKLFGDESADQRAQKVFAIAGVIGNEDEWISTKKQWSGRTEGKDFHAAKCENEYAKYPDSKEHKENLELYKDLTQILASSPLSGIGVAIDLAAHKDFFGESRDDFGYFKCLADLIITTTQLTDNFNKMIPESEYPEDELFTLEFTFDNRIKSNGTAGSLYDAFINQPEITEEVKGILPDKISFDCRSNPRIQIADLFARETMREMERTIAGKPLEARKSFQALDETKKFIFLFRDRDYCRRWKDEQSFLEARSGMNIRDYVQWLIKSGRVQNGRVHDNWRNRYEYYAWKDELKKKTS